MENIKNIIEQIEKDLGYNNNSGISYLKLAVKNEKGVPVSTGPQQVSLKKAEVVKNIKIFVSKDNYIEVEGIRYYFETNDGLKVYDVPFYSKKYYRTNKPEDKKINYLLKSFKNLKEGDNLILEYVKENPTMGYIKVKKIENGENVNNDFEFYSSDDDYEINLDEGKIEEIPF